MNIFDSLHREEFTIVPNHNEQACAYAADGYARVSGKIGFCATTAGPGATNLLSGTAASFYDSIPVLNVVGQVPEHKYDAFARQIGFQEIKTEKIFDSVTKEVIKYSFAKDVLEAIDLTKEGRYGPVVLEVADNVQRE